MAVNTYVALETKTLSSAVSSVTFDVSTYTAYTDLQIIFNGGISTASANSYIRFNGDTGANYYSIFYEGRQGGTAATTRQTSASTLQLDYYGSPSTTQSMMVVDIFNYRKTGYYRPVMAKYGDTTNSTYSGVGYMQGAWTNTSTAITSIQMYPNGCNYNAGSTFTLYGIAASNTSAKATGGTIYSDSTYFYHLFTAGGTFTPLSSLTVDVLAVAGGGGGGQDDGGGGGAGGLAIQTSRSLTATGYSITVGGGGGGSSTGSVTGTSGSPSTFDTITATGGGGGGSGSASPYAGLNGGSGGGGSYRGSGGTGTTGTSGGATLYGNNGGASVNAGPYPCGGGGGAGAIGGSGSGTVPGNGGVGRTDSFINAIGAATGAPELVSGNYYFAGGGGGSVASGGTALGVGGYGGGGVGSTSSSVGSAYSGQGTSGKIATGGGGGAGLTSGYNSGNGGSGVVIVRYAK